MKTGKNTWLSEDDVSSTAFHSLAALPSTHPNIATAHVNASIHEVLGHRVRTAVLHETMEALQLYTL